MSTAVAAWIERRDSARARALNKSFEARLKSLGTKGEPQIVKILARTSEAQRAVITDAELTEMAATGAAPRALLEKWRQSYSQQVVDDLNPKWRATLATGVSDIVASMAAVAGITVDLPDVGRRLETWIVGRGDTYLKNVTALQAQAVNAVVRHGVVDLGLSGRALAPFLRPVIGLTERDAVAVVRKRAALEKAGLSGERLAKQADRYAAFLERQRALRVARTEISAAYNSGQLAGIYEAEKGGWLRVGHTEKVWLTARDEAVCPYCGPLNDTVVGLSEAFPRDAKLGQGAMTDGQTPPLHPNCHCTIIYRTKD